TPPGSHRGRGAGRPDRPGAAAGHGRGRRLPASARPGASDARGPATARAFGARAATRLDRPRSPSEACAPKDPAAVGSRCVKKVVVLGCGLVGGVIARDLAADPDLEVTAVDASADALGRLARETSISTRKADLSKTDEIRAAIHEADAVVGAVPGFLG